MSVVTPTITSGGAKLPETVRIYAIDIWSEVNRIPTAELRVADGDFTKGALPVSDSGHFDLGKVIEIKVRREGKEAEDHLLFKGIVVKQAIEAVPNGSQLVVVLKDTTIKLHGTRANKVFNKKTDLEIIDEILKEAEIQSGTHDKLVADPRHPCMVQYDCTAWDFIVLRADALGMVVTVDQGKLSLKKLHQVNPTKYELKVGIDTIYDFEMETDARHPFETVLSSGWDPSMGEKQPPQRKDIQPPKDPPFQANYALAKAVGRESCSLSHMVPAAAGELKMWSNARWIRGCLSKLRGRFSVPGNGKYKLLDHIKLMNLGQQFSAELCITGILHRIDSVDWDTELQLGFAPERHCERNDIGDVAAGGLVNGARGLQIGLVQAFDESAAEGDLRVKVVLPGIDEQGKSAIWARLASPEAGDNHGYYFRPEMGDEVVVGFLNEDPRHPIILGAFFGAKNKPPVAFKSPNKLNDSKGIITKKGTKIIFDDGDKPSITIETRSKNKIFIDDADGISISDNFGNTIVLNVNGITLDAGLKTVTIKGAKVDVA